MRHIPEKTHQNPTKRHQNPTKYTKTKPFVVKSVSETNHQRFSKSTIRETFNLKPDLNMENTHSYNQGNYFYQNNVVKKKP